MGTSKVKERSAARGPAAEDPLALEQLRFEEVLERVQDDGDLFALKA